VLPTVDGTTKAITACATLIAAAASTARGEGAAASSAGEQRGDQDDGFAEHHSRLAEHQRSARKALRQTRLQGQSVQRCRCTGIALIHE